MKKNPQEYAEFKTALGILGDKWSGLVLLCLFDHPRRFVDIQNKTQGINPRTLTQRLHMLEAAGLIEKREYKEFPPRTEYRLTEKAHELKAALHELKKWAKKYCSKAQPPSASSPMN
ncbi:MAG TPA: helix-turn-helix domain-containing protein [Candidatus Limnocylindria bacterium]|nr:helix-turn-helix domain-containing protein [Candidatus Limnocylindria bacterium]